MKEKSIYNWRENGIKECDVDVDMCLELKILF